MSDEIFVEKPKPADKRSHDEVIADAVKFILEKRQFRDVEIEEYLEQSADPPLAIARNLEHYFGKD